MTVVTQIIVVTTPTNPDDDVWHCRDTVLSQPPRYREFRRLLAADALTTCCVSRASYKADVLGALVSVEYYARCGEE